MNFFTEKLRSFLHDPVDKCFDIPTHIGRAKNYAEKIGISNIEKEKGSDQIASCMERSLLPKDIKQPFDEIKHPFSEAKLSVDNILNKKDNIFKRMEELYSKIGLEISNQEDKKKFFFLWRNLENIIFQEFKNEKWSKYLSLLPADTRIPDHSIWEHLKIASAIKAYWDDENKLLLQNNSLFLFTIGPVQSFISQARKTQDFYMGSFILSYLTFKAMELIIDKYGPTNIIYPDLYKQPLMDLWLTKNLFKIPDFEEELIQIPTIPNRFVAILPITDKNEIITLANEMKLQIRKWANQAIFSILKELSINYENIKIKIDSQLSEFPEIYWVAIPWRINERDLYLEDLKDYFNEDLLNSFQKLWNFASKNGENPPNIGLLYELIYSALEKSIGSRKNLREFNQPSIEEKGRKCSVCGERDVIFFKETQNKDKFTKYNSYTLDLTGKKEVSPKFIEDGEGLCSVCFLKRTLEIYLEKELSKTFDNLIFPSTAEVASADFKEKALNKAKKEYFEYQNKLIEILSNIPLVSPLPKLKESFNNKNNIEGSWFYEENLNQKQISKELGISRSEDQIKELTNTLKKLTNKIGKPNPYYAILHLDGDNMGKWLSGELLPSIEYSYNSNVWKELEKNEVEIEENNKRIKIPFKEALLKYSPQKILTPAIHASISTALRNYTLEFVREIIEKEHLGKLVYAGGDDVLAFVNLKDLFDVMQKLRWAFSGQINIENGKINVNLSNQTGFVEKNGKYILTMGPKATASMGVVIAHYKIPLQIVIKKVFEIEKIAKKEDKNGFAICLMKRSGEERRAKAKWSYNSKDTIEILKNIEKAFDEENEKGYIAKSFIQKINTEFFRLKEEGNLSATGNIFNVELLRLLKRSYNLPKKDKKSVDTEFLIQTYEELKELFWNTGANIDNFINFCIIATFLHKGED